MTDESEKVFVTVEVTYKDDRAAKYENVFHFKADDNWFFIKYNDGSKTGPLKALYINRQELKEVEVF